MARHTEHWRPRIERGQMVIFGPVLDASGSWGLGVVEADDEQQLRAFAAGDPVVTTGTIGVATMLGGFVRPGARPLADWGYLRQRSRFARSARPPVCQGSESRAAHRRRVRAHWRRRALVTESHPGPLRDFTPIDYAFRHSQRRLGADGCRSPLLCASLGRSRLADPHPAERDARRCLKILTAGVSGWCRAALCRMREVSRGGLWPPAGQQGAAGATDRRSLGGLLVTGTGRRKLPTMAGRWQAPGCLTARARCWPPW